MNRLRVRVIGGPDKDVTCEMESETLSIGTGSQCGLRLSDPTVSTLHLELQITEHGLRLRDTGSKNGTHLGQLRISDSVTTEPVDVTIGQTTLRIEPSGENIELPLSDRWRFGELVGKSVAMRHLFSVLERVAASDAAVLIEGESGSGKELAAEAIYQQSKRAEQPFIVVDCGSLTETLIESELFGHVRGSFTGATSDRRGAFDEANGGTVFLDEIGELPLPLQTRLLRVLEHGEVKPLGQNSHHTVDVRVIAATNRSLEAECAKGTFREDLYFRLAVVKVSVPPLRYHMEDVEMLARECLEQRGYDPDAVLSPRVLKLLVSHRWPGNVRELRNVVERIAIMPEALPVLSATALSAPAVGDGGTDGVTSLPFGQAKRLVIDRFEEAYLRAYLERSGGVVAEAARAAEVPRPSFHRLLRKHGLRGGDSESE